MSKPAPNAVDLTGRKFGNWSVLGFSHTTPKEHRMWKCICDCGTKRIVWGGDLVGGRSKSCGCASIKTNTTFGFRKSELYQTYMGMKKRCYNTKHPNYPNYGGRGITICDRWLADPNNFAADMGPRPDSSYSIDRIDVNGNYEPDNCRWATKKEQQGNRRSNVFLTYNGITCTREEWARHLGVSSFAISCRLSHGWTLADALTIARGGRRAI